MSDWDTRRRFGFRVSSGASRGPISGLTVSRGIGKDTVSGTEEGMAVIICLVGPDAVPWLGVERKPVLTIDEMAEGSLVPCIGSAAAQSEIRSFWRGAR